MNLYEAIKGVFDDLDDGGLTEEEALAQIRDLVGMYEMERDAQDAFVKGGHA